MSDKPWRVERAGPMTLYLRPGVRAAAIMRAIETPGDLLKRARKSLTRRVGPYVIKQSRGEAGLGLIKRTANPARYRQAWLAANHLWDHGIGVPEPCAYVEMGFLGLITGNAMIAKFLAGHHNVEDHARQLAAAQAGHDAIAAFLEALAQAVSDLNAAGAYHADLSGKNIFTTDGASFVFIDLDAVSLDVDYTDALRLRTHVQLYDSFCDLWGPELLGPFIARLGIGGGSQAQWLEAVQQGQQTRRAKHTARS